MCGSNVSNFPFPVDTDLSNFSNCIDDALIPQIPECQFLGTRPEAHKGDDLGIVDFNCEWKFTCNPKRS